MSFRIAPAPHQHLRRSTSQLMQLVLLAMVPGVLAQIWFFGWGVLIQIALAIGVALFAEALCLGLRQRSIQTGWRDYTAIVTATLLAVAIPPLAPWWLIIIGTLFAIILVKHLFGGVGQNIFNPAMAGYVVLLISFPVQMTSWLPPAELTGGHPNFLDSLLVIFTGYTSSGFSLEQLRLVDISRTMDALVMATPLDHIKTELGLGATLNEARQAPIFDNLAGLGWSTINLAYLVGGLFLLQQRVIQWHIPVALLGSLSVCAALGYILAPDQLPGLDIHLLSGGTMLAAFFIATDPVSAATSARGKLVYAALIGVLIYLIRTFGGYPDAIAFGVLLANMCVPVIDQYTRPRVYGYGRSA